MGIEINYECDYCKIGAIVSGRLVSLDNWRITEGNVASCDKCTIVLASIERHSQVFGMLTDKPILAIKLARDISMVNGKEVGLREAKAVVDRLRIISNNRQDGPVTISDLIKEQLPK